MKRNTFVFPKVSSRCIIQWMYSSIKAMYCLWTPISLGVQITARQACPSYFCGCSRIQCDPSHTMPTEAWTNCLGSKRLQKCTALRLKKKIKKNDKPEHSEMGSTHKLRNVSLRKTIQHCRKTAALLKLICFHKTRHGNAFLKKIQNFLLKTSANTPEQ